MEEWRLGGKQFLHLGKNHRCGLVAYRIKKGDILLIPALFFIDLILIKICYRCEMSDIGPNIHAYMTGPYIGTGGLRRED